jgi:tetratricopeptide (TPR) repeat protein
MSFRPRLPVVLVLVLALFAPVAARADDSTTAREHYQRGTSFYDLGKYAEAIQEFEAAYQLKNDPALLYNLAQSHRLAGNAEQALHFYRTYLRYVPKAANRAEIEDRIKQLDQLVAQKSAMQTTPPNLAIPPPVAPPPVQTAPPPVTAPPEPAPPPVTAPPPGVPPALPEVAAPPPPGLGTPAISASSPAAPPKSHRAMIRAGEITAVAGGAVFIIGAAYGAAAKGAANDVNNQAKNGEAFDPSIQTRGKNAQTAEAVLMTVGALGAATGAVLFFYGRHLEAQERATLTPIASAHGGGVSLRVTF